MSANFPGISFDELDRKIVAALQLNGRASWKSLAPWVGASESTVQRRYIALHQANVVRVVGAVDVARTNTGMSMLVRLVCRPGRVLEAVEHIIQRPETRFLAIVSGTADIIVDFVAADFDELSHLLVVDLPGAELIQTTESVAVTRLFTNGPLWDTGILPAEARDALGAAQVRPYASEEWGARPEELSAVEKQIVDQLFVDGRLSNQEVANRIGKSEATVRRAVIRLTENGLLQFRTLVEPRFLGYDIEFMLWLSVSPSQLEAAGIRLAEHPGTKFLAATTGRFNLVGQIVLASQDLLYEYTRDVIGALPGLVSADITLQLDTVKRNWSRVDDFRDRAVRVAGASRKAAGSAGRSSAPAGADPRATTTSHRVAAANRSAATEQVEEQI